MKNEIGYVDKIRKTGKKVMSLDCLKFARKQFSKKSGMRCYIDLYAAHFSKYHNIRHI